MNNQLLLLTNFFEKNSSILEISDLEFFCFTHNIRGHIAIMNNPYLNKIIEGAKTLESRFTENKIAPFRKVEKGDILIFKLAAGTINSIALVGEVEYFGDLKDNQAEVILLSNKEALQVEDDFIKLKSSSRYASLLKIEKVVIVKETKINKSDRRTWITLFKNEQPTLF